MVITFVLLAAAVVIMGVLSAPSRPREGLACPSGYVLILTFSSRACVPGVTPRTTLIPPVETTPK
jgi:hypothetical protein